MTTRDLVLIALFAAITAVLGLFPALTLPITGVPVTAQTLGVMLAGSILGARRGGLTLVVFLVLVAVGLPLLAGGRGGAAVLFGVTAGFLFSWPVAAFVIGWLDGKGLEPLHDCPCCRDQHFWRHSYHLRGRYCLDGDCRRHSPKQGTLWFLAVYSRRYIEGYCGINDDGRPEALSATSAQLGDIRYQRNKKRFLRAAFIQVLKSSDRDIEGYSTVRITRPR